MNDNQQRRDGQDAPGDGSWAARGEGSPHGSDDKDSEETVILPRHTARRGYQPPEPQPPAHGAEASEKTQHQPSVTAEESEAEHTQYLPTYPTSSAPDYSAASRTRSLRPESGEYPAAERTAASGYSPGTGDGRSAPAWQGHFVSPNRGTQAEPPSLPEAEPAERKGTSTVLVRVLQGLTACLILVVGIGIGAFAFGSSGSGTAPATTTTVTATSTTTTTVTTATPTTAPPVTTTVIPPAATVTESEQRTVFGPTQTVTAQQTVTEQAPTVTVTAQPNTEATP